MDENTKDASVRLLNLVQEFLKELKKDRASRAVSLESSLERDLGIDSLGRVELFSRVEKEFSVYLSDRLIIESENVKDILTGILKANPSIQYNNTQHTHTASESIFDPSQSASLVEILIKRATEDPDRPHLHLVDDHGNEKIITYGELLKQATKVAGGLYEQGLRPKETVAIMLPTHEHFFFAFFGILIAGGIPVPIYPPLKPNKIEEYALREATILEKAEVRILITFHKAEKLSDLLKLFVTSLKSVCTVDKLLQSNQKCPTFTPAREDTTLIQFTSGSTSTPKGVQLTHHNILSNIKAIGKALNPTPSDVGISWLPLYHDMGLIGAWFSCFYYGFPAVIMSPITFLTHPERWLWKIHYHRATVSAAPNFAYELCVKRVDEKKIEGLDLSSWRLSLNGAENVNPKTIERFVKKFAPYGYKEETMLPVYGLAESSVGLIMPEIGNKPIIDKIDREKFETENKAQPTNDESKALDVVCCGKPLPEHDVKIIDLKTKQELPDREVGSLIFKGPSTMNGYYKNPEATQKANVDGWWDSGDFAYKADGQFYITGRKKDVIIKAGRNIYPQEIEEITSQVKYIRKGCIAAFGVEDKALGTETIVIVAETKETDKKAKALIADEVIDKVSVLLGTPPDKVVLVPPQTIPKTSSGKLQRSACKQEYISGNLTKNRIPVWAQIVKLSIKGAANKAYSYLKKAGSYLYTGYVGFVLTLFAPVAWLGLYTLPKSLSAKLCKGIAKIIMNLICCPIKVSGLENIDKDKPMIYVANHQSYIDAIALLVALPENALFIGKEEVLKFPLVKSFFKRLGHLTVNRMEFSKNISDNNRIIDALKKGCSIIIFPEGTFSYATGLRQFKMGAFKVAVDTGKPICPISIKGARKVLRGEEKLLNANKIEITIGKPITPASKDWSEVTKLHTIARKEISKHCGEESIDLVASGLEGL